MKDYKNLNNNKMSTKNKKTLSVNKNKFVGLTIDSSSDSENDTIAAPLCDKSRCITPPPNIIKNEPSEVCLKEELEPLREVELPKKEKTSVEWKVIDKRFNKEGNGRRIIREKNIFVKENDIEYGDNLYLHSQWDVYCHKKSVVTWENKDYIHIYQINSIGTFCRFFNNFNILDKITYEFFIMKDKIIPRWEDNANRNGGICSILITSVFDKRSKTDIGSEFMLSICLLIMNNSLIKDNDKINGISYSLRARNTVVIKIWYNDWNYNMNSNFPSSLLDYFEGRISGVYKNDTIAKFISVRYSKIEPIL
jgi:hypothetical protein